MSPRKDDVLSKIFIHTKDLSREELTSIPKRADTVYEITEDIMRQGAYIYKGDTCFYIPPDAIVKIEYLKGPCPDCKGDGECPNCGGEEDDDEG